MHTNLVEYAISESKVLTIKTVSYLSRERNYIDSVLKKYLHEIKQPHLLNQVSYCLHELAGNANRANTKRVYFQDKGLDISSPEEYARGLETFRQETFTKIEKFQAKQKKAGLYIKIDFHLKGERLRIRVRNNTLLTDEEKQRIQKKFEIMKEYKTVPDAFLLVEDSTEGAGLGLVMIIQLLQNLGFGTDSFSIDTDEKETIATLYLQTEQAKSLDIA